MRGQSVTGTASERVPSASAGFVARAAAWALLLFGIIRVPWVQQNLLLPFAGIQGRIACALVGTEPNSVFIGLSCVGADPMALVLASVLAFPAPWLDRIRGCSIGLLLILALNTARIGTLSRVASAGDLFNVLHVYVWPVVLIIAAAAYVFYWMGSALESETFERTLPASRHSFARPEMRRFLGVLVLFVLAFYALFPWLMRSQAVLEIARWATVAAAATMGAIGVPAEVAGTYLKTPYGTWVVTQACIVTPLLPVYLAAVFVLPISALRRVVAGAAALPLFLLLGSARLLVLAVPAAILGSHATAVHAFYQVLLAAVVVGLTIWLPTASRPNSDGLRATFRALAVGIGGGVTSGLVFRAWLWPALSEIGPSVHLGHGYDDSQGALSLMPAFLIGFFAALWVAQPRPIRSSGFLGGLGLAAVSGAAVLTSLGELAYHLEVELPIAATRGVSLALPILITWWLARPELNAKKPSQELI